MAARDGRFAPSPTGPLHLGNLRTALVAWLRARTGGGRFVLRDDDLDAQRSRPHFAAAQQADLDALGLTWDGPVMSQSTRHEAYRAAVDILTERGLLYPCFCSRREIAEAASAPHGAGDSRYSGACLGLTAAQRRARAAQGRPSALRLRAAGSTATIHDGLVGDVTAVVDDIVVVRADGIVSYNLATVVDDHHQAIGEVVRGDDLLPSAVAQAHLAQLLGFVPPTYLHVPLMLGPDRSRLAKRHGAVTLQDVLHAGSTVEEVRGWLAASLGLIDAVTPMTIEELVGSIDWTRLSPCATVVTPQALLPAFVPITRAIG